MGHLCKPFWSIKIWPSWQGGGGGAGKVKICSRNGLSLDSEPRSPLMDQRPRKWTQINQGQWGDYSGARAISGFQGSLVHLGAAGRLRSQNGQILTFPDPRCQSGQILMVLHVLCSTRTYWGHWLQRQQWLHDYNNCNDYNDSIRISNSCDECAHTLAQILWIKSLNRTMALY